MRVLIDGAPVPEDQAAVSVFDWGLMRGFGVFELIRCYRGVPFRLPQHLERLERSAMALGVSAPDPASVTSWVGTVTEGRGDGHVRVILTAGGRDADVKAPPTSIVMWEPMPTVPPRLRLLPTVAPWHPGTDAGGFPGVKWISYAPNMASTDKAQRAGFDDALLITDEGIVLEGPTFTVGWVHEGRVETPSLECGILASITREVMIECAGRLGLPLSQGRFPLERMVDAEEAFALSTVKEVTPVSMVGESEIAAGAITADLSRCFGDIVEEETGHRPAATGIGASPGS